MANALNLEGLEFLAHPDAAPRFTTKPPEWIATYLPRYCFAAADRTDSDCRGLAQLVRELHRDGFWQRLFPDWETCCQSLFQRPAAWVEQVVEGVRVLHSQGHQGEIPREQALSAAAAQAQPLAQHGEIGNGKRRDPKTGLFVAAEDAVPLRMHGGSRTDNIRSGDFGTSQTYLLRRLARDAPEILERVKAGEFKSARAAAIEAGIIKPVPTIRVTSDMQAVAAKLCQHLTREQRIRLIDLLAPDL